MVVFGSRSVAVLILVVLWYLVDYQLGPRTRPYILKRAPPRFCAMLSSSLGAIRLDSHLLGRPFSPNKEAVLMLLQTAAIQPGDHHSV